MLKLQIIEYSDDIFFGFFLMTSLMNFNFKNLVKIEFQQIEGLLNIFADGCDILRTARTCERFIVEI